MTYSPTKFGGAIVAAVVAMALVVIAPSTAAAADRSASGAGVGSPVVANSDAGLMKSLVTGSFGDSGKLRGTFTPSGFEVVDGQLMATGTLDAVLRDHGPVGQVSKVVSVPVMGAGGNAADSMQIAQQDPQQGGCDILNLVLGPLDLNLLGLEVHLDQIVLDIIATPGPGNLLGNLLCAIAGLLDGTGTLTQISQLLNQILALLNLTG